MKALQLLDISVAPDLHELTQHGTPVFPCAGYDEDPGKYLVGNIPWHWHEEIEVILALEGETRVLCGETEFLLHPGEVVFVNSNVLHKLKRGRKDFPCRINSLLFTPEFVSGFPQSMIQQRYIAPLIRCSALSEVLLQPAVPWQAEAISHFRNAFSAFISDRYGYEIVVQIELMQMLLAILENLQDRVCESPLMQNKDATRIKQMLGFIHEHYAEPLTVSQISAASVISESECYRCFRKVLDTSPIDYLLQYRIRAAAGLLSGTDRSISDICFATGFNSPSYFAKVFRQELLISPRKYRATYQASSKEDSNIYSIRNA
ncbi:MAG: AraC family transcriptional regulator [Eubacteriales bacterium]|nr:AraC family transcriptional regulator [Eubacteriales bacterium]